MEPAARAAALRRAAQWAARARQVRYECRSSLRSGETTLADVVARSGSEELIGRIKLLWILESLPGAGKVTTRRSLASLGIDETMSLNQLDESTLQRVLDGFTSPPSPRTPKTGPDAKGTVM